VWCSASAVAVEVAAPENGIVLNQALPARRRGGNRRRQEGVTGLSCHPVLPIFATCGSDGTVRVWNAEARCMVMARVAFSKLLPGAALLRACQRDRSCAPVRLRLRVREGH